MKEDVQTTKQMDYFFKKTQGLKEAFSQGKRTTSLLESVTRSA